MLPHLSPPAVEILEAACSRQPSYLLSNPHQTLCEQEISLFCIKPLRFQGFCVTSANLAYLEQCTESNAEQCREKDTVCTMLVQTIAKAEEFHQHFSLWPSLPPMTLCGPSEPWIFRQMQTMLSESWDSANSEDVNCSRNPTEVSSEKTRAPAAKKLGNPGR